MAKSIYVVEDRPAFNKVICDTITQINPEIVVKGFMRGDEAVEEIYQQIPNALILDLFVPGVNGRDIINQLRGKPEYQEIPIIVISNLKLPTEEINKFSSMPKVEFYPKLDVTPEDIANAALKYLN